MLKRISNQQRWESKQSLEKAKESLGIDPVSNRLRRRAIQQSNMQRNSRRMQAFEEELVRQSSQETQNVQSSSISLPQRSSRLLNPVQMAVIALYLSAITNLVDGAQKELINRQRKSQNKEISNNRNSIEDEDSSTPPPTQTQEKSSVHKYKKGVKKTQVSSPQNEGVNNLCSSKIQRDNSTTLNDIHTKHALVQVGYNRDEISLPIENIESLSSRCMSVVDEESKQSNIVHVRKKRYFTQLVPEQRGLSMVFNQFLREKHSEFHTLLQIIRGTIADNQGNIWQDPRVASFLVELKEKLIPMIAIQPVVFDPEKDTIGVELFEFLHLNHLEISEEYRKTLFSLIASGSVHFSPHDLSFLSALYRPEMSLIEKEVVYILLSFLPEHPRITPQVLAQIAADIKIEALNEARIKRQQVRDFQGDYFAYLKAVVRTGNNPHIKVSEPFPMIQNLFLNNAFYIGSNYGFCTVLSYAFLYDMAKYGEVRGQKKFKRLIQILEYIHTLPYEFSIPYHRAIFSFASPTAFPIYRKYLPTQSEFRDPNLYIRNTQYGLRIQEIAQLLFDPSHFEGKTSFLIVTTEHVVSAIRKYKENKVTKQQELIVNFFDANAGSYEVTNEETLKRVMSISLGEEKTQSILPIDDPIKLGEYKNAHGARLKEIFKNRVLGNPRFTHTGINLRTTMNAYLEVDAINNNMNIPKSEAIIQKLAQVQSKLESFYEVASSKEGSTFSLLLDGEDVVSKIGKKTLFSNINEELKSISSPTKFRDVTTKITHVTHAIEKSLVEHSKVNQDIQREFEEIQRSLQELYKSLDDAVPLLDRPAQEKNIVITPDFEVENDLYGLDVDDDKTSSQEEKYQENKKVIYSESELKDLGVYDVKESIEVKMMMKDLDIALANLLDDAGLDPAKHIVPEIEVVKASIGQQSDFNALLANDLHVLDVTTGKEVTVPVRASNFKNKAIKLHEKLVAINGKLDKFYKGVSVYSTVTTLTQVQSMVHMGSVFKKLSLLEQTNFVVNTIDATLDVAANTAGAVNKLYKTMLQPVHSLSSISRVLGRVSGGVGLFASGMMMTSVAINYANNPNFFTGMELGFSVANTALSIATAAYPPLAIITIPVMLIFDAIKESIMESMRREKDQNRELEFLLAVANQIKREEAIHRRLRISFPINVVNGVMMVPARGDINNILFDENGWLYVYMLRISGIGYQEGYSSPTLFPKDTCFKGRIVKTEKCPWSESEMSYSYEKSRLEKFCQGGFLLKDVSMPSAPAPYRLEDLDKDDIPKKRSKTIKNAHSVLLSDTILTVKRIKEYVVRQGYIGDLSYPHLDIYRFFLNADRGHRLMLCAGSHYMRLNRKDWNAGVPILHFGISYLDECIFAYRRCTHFESRSKEIKTVMLSSREYSCRREFRARMRFQTFCEVSESLDQYACATIQQSNTAHIQIFLQGSNKVKLLPHPDKQPHPYGFIFTAKAIDEIRINETPEDTDNNIIYVDTETSTMRYRDVSVNFVNVKEAKTPLLMRLDSGFMVSFDTSTSQLDVVLYSSTSDKEQFPHVLHYQNYKALGLGSLIRNKLVQSFGESYTPSSFQVEGIHDPIDDTGEINEKSHRVGFFIPKEEGGRDRVLIVRLSDDVTELIGTFNGEEYTLLHLEEFFYDYTDPDRLYGEDDVFTAYFYNEKQKTVIIQKGDTPLDSFSVLPVDEKPAFTRFSDGSQRLLIQGLSIQYDINKVPKEMHITAEAFRRNSTNTDEAIHNVAELMSTSYFVAESRSVGEILLKDIPYQSNSGKILNVSGHFDPLQKKYSLGLSERDGKRYLRIPFSHLKEHEYDYYALQVDGGYHLYASRAVQYMTSIIENGVIMESKMPSLEQIFPYVEIKKIVPHNDGILIHEKNGNVLLGVLEGPNSYMNVVSISEKFIEDNGYSTTSPADINRALTFARALYGEILDPHYTIITSKSKQPRVFNTMLAKPIELNTKCFYVDNLEIYKKKVYVKKTECYPYAPVDALDTNLHDNIDPLSVNLLASVKNNDNSKSTYMWYYEADALLVNSEPASEQNPNRVYQLAVFLQSGTTALLRMDETHTQEQNLGLIIPGITTLTFHPSLAMHTIRLHYSSELLQYLEELILDTSGYEGLFPIFSFEVEVERVVLSRLSYKDVYLRLDYKIGNGKTSSLGIILAKFFEFTSENNPYSGCIIIDKKTYTANDIIRSVTISEG